MWRRTDCALLAGVCSGIARHLSVDVRWIRLAALLLGLSHWSGLIIYALLGLVLPNENSESACLPATPQRNWVATMKEMPRRVIGLVPGSSDEPGVLPVAPARLVGVGLLMTLFGGLILAERLRLLGPFRLQYFDIAFLLLAGAISLQYGLRNLTAEEDA